MEKNQYTYEFKLDRVIDGDTVDTWVDLGFTVWVKVRFRLDGIDTPELRDSDAGQRYLAQAAKTRLIEMLEDDGVKVVESFKTDKYGRWLGTLYVNGVNINQQLIDEGHAVEYNGGPR